MIAKRWYWIVGILFSSLLGVFLVARYWLTPQPILGALKLTLGGSTNEQGEVLITITNCSRWSITYWPRLESKENGLWPPYPFNTPFSSLGKELRLEPHTGSSFYVRPSTNTTPWRVWVDYRAETERQKSVLNLRRFLDDSGLTGVAQRIPLDLGGWVLYPESKDPFNRAGP